jgi:hypothetical protein
MVKKKILILSFYFKPDLSAGSFRATAILNSFLKESSKNYEIEVITTMPNRYKEYKVKTNQFDKYKNLTIRRFSTLTHQSGIIGQSLGFAKFFINVLWYVKSKKYDVIFVTSSRLMTAFLGVFIARVKSIPVYTDLRDIFLDTIKSIKLNLIIKLLIPIILLIERYTVNNSTHINLVSFGFNKYFKKKYPYKDYTYHTNGIDQIFYNVDSKKGIDHDNEKKVLTILYAGNIGSGQGLDKILPMLASKLKNNVKFVIYGSGGKIGNLRKNINKMKITNISIFNPLAREKLLAEYEKADILFLHLNDNNAFKKVLPSKIFEYAATKKPILAGVDGYAKKFIEKEIDNAQVFTPCDCSSALNAFSKLKLIDTKRDEFIQKYKRDIISDRIKLQILELLKISTINKIKSL